MKITVSSSYSGVIPIAEYSNVRPGFTAQLEVEVFDQDADKVHVSIDAMQKELQSLCYQNFKNVAEAAKIEKIKKDRADFHWYVLPDGRDVPSVTSILNYDTNFMMPEEELSQYASQGTVIHKQVDVFIREGVWKGPSKIPELAPHIFIIKKGNLGLSLDGWDFPSFVEKFKLTDLKILPPGTNEKHAYGGEPDFSCIYEGKLTLADVKRTPDKIKHFQQTAGYCKLDGMPPFEQMMLAPINDKTDRGYSKPIVETRIDHFFELFLFKRKQFYVVYGV